MTAKRSAAYSKTSHKFCFITNTYLAKLNSCTKNRCKILHKITKIDPFLRSKVKNKLCVVKCIFSIYKLHIKIVKRNFFHTGIKRFYFKL